MEQHQALCTLGKKVPAHSDGRPDCLFFLLFRLFFSQRNKSENIRRIRVDGNGGGNEKRRRWQKGNRSRKKEALSSFAVCVNEWIKLRAQPKETKRVSTCTRSVATKPIVDDT